LRIRHAGCLTAEGLLHPHGGDGRGAPASSGASRVPPHRRPWNRDTPRAPSRGASIPRCARGSPRAQEAWQGRTGGGRNEESIGCQHPRSIRRPAPVQRSGDGGGQEARTYGRGARRPSPEALQRVSSLRQREAHPDARQGREWNRGTSSKGRPGASFGATSPAPRGGVQPMETSVIRTSDDQRAAGSAHNLFLSSHRPYGSRMRVVPPRSCRARRHCS
jgi:hypothetical protein